MSSVNFLEKLLDGVSVEWKALKDLTLPTKNIKWRETKRTYRYIDLTSVSIETKAITETIEISSDDAPSRAQKIVEKNDVIFATTRPTQKRYCLIGDQYSGEIASTGYCVLRAKQKEVLPKWIWHWIASSKFNKYVEENQSGSAYPAISDAKVKEFEIPIPCPDNPKKSLEIQAEIVRILDAMTAHTAELTAELTARKKQYNYYRDKLLIFVEGKVEWTVLGNERFVEVANAARRPVKASLRAPGETPYYGANNIQDYVDGYTHDGEYVLIAEDGSASLENYSIQYANGKFWANNHVHVVRGKQGLNTRFLYHYLRTVNFIPYLPNKDRSKLTKAEMLKIPLPIPCPESLDKSLGIQAEIVRVLDKLDTLTNSITEGLPREIELRQKQYAYYRDLLLSFPKPPTI